MVSVRLFLTQLIFFQILLCTLTFFTNQPNLVIIKLFFAKLNLKIEYLPLHGRLIWDYKNANEQLINHAIESFNWQVSCP